MDDASQALWQLRHAYYLQNRPACRTYYEKFKDAADLGDVSEDQKSCAITLVALSMALKVSELKEEAKADMTFKFLLAAIHTKTKNDPMVYEEGSKFHGLLEAIQEQNPNGLSQWGCFRIGAAFMIHNELGYAQSWLKKAGSQRDAKAHLVMTYLLLNQFDQALRSKLELITLPDSDDDIGCTVVRILVTFNPKAERKDVEDAYESVKELRNSYYTTPATSLWKNCLSAKLDMNYEVGTYQDENAFETEDEDMQVPELKPCYHSLNLLNPQNKNATWTSLREAEQDPHMIRYLDTRKQELKQVIASVKA